MTLTLPSSASPAGNVERSVVAGLDRLSGKLEGQPALLLLQQARIGDRAAHECHLLAAPGEAALGLERAADVVERQASRSSARSRGARRTARRRSARCRRRCARWSGTASRAPRQDALRPVHGRRYARRRADGPVAACANRTRPLRLPAKSQLRRPCASTRSSIDRPRQDEPPDRGLLRQAATQADLGLQRLRLQDRLAAHVGRRRERHVGEGDGEPGKEDQRRRPGHHEVATGAGLDVLDQPVAHEVDGCGDEEERGHGQQQAAETQPAYPTMPSQPVPCRRGRAWVRRSLGHWREAVPLLSQSGARWTYEVRALCALAMVVRPALLVNYVTGAVE